MFPPVNGGAIPWEGEPSLIPTNNLVRERGGSINCCNIGIVLCFAEREEVLLGRSLASVLQRGVKCDFTFALTVVTRKKKGARLAVLIFIAVFHE